MVYSTRCRGEANTVPLFFTSDRRKMEPPRPNGQEVVPPQGGNKEVEETTLGADCGKGFNLFAVEEKVGENPEIFFKI